ncbi:amp dependent CoA ligase [Panaeolus papilionaceus]|nr:amp dependent CoA ligase [Panaeolus papilionaceus]
MYVKSPYPEPPALPEVNAHYVFFKRPDQAEWPNFTIHIDAETGEQVMFRDFASKVQDLATGLGAPKSQGGMGIRAEDNEIIGIMAENSSEYITAVQACIYLATPFALLSSYSTPFELKHALTLSKATRVFAGAKYLKTLLPVAKAVGLSSDKIHVLRPAGKDGKGAAEAKGRKSLHSIIDGVRRKGIKTVDIRPATKNTLAYLVFSSGTSGLPKAVMISHGNLIYSVGQAMVMAQVVAQVYTPPPPANPEGVPVTLAFLPLHHTYGLHSYCFRNLLAPHTLVLMPRWDVSVALRCIPQYKVSSLTLIPSVVHQLVNYPAIEKIDFSSVQFMGSGAAYLPPELGAKMAKLLPSEAHVTEGYGMSECTIAAITQPMNGTLGGKLKQVPGCTGVLLPGMEARIIRDDGTEADVNEPGELWLRSPNVALGYWNNPKANKSTFVDGWLHTGDKFRVDENNNFWFADRAKDTLKVSGAQVSPVEIENCLLDQPDKLIIDATVAGVSGGRTSDEKVPRAWVVLSAEGKARGVTETIKVLDDWHKTHLSKYKHLRGGIEVVNEIPKSPTGKVLRRVLQDKYEKELKKGKVKGKL